ncbi:MAG: DNA primase [Armatimonadetes bacterium]|nr:DNA primase [Armatimonadota bacterium]MDE2207669.1 DNA primase [Armatimonadota bacterium]
MALESLQDVKERVRERTDIVALIGACTSLKRVGRSFVGLCPFHDDQHPSFHVNPDGFYKCFACGASGDVFTFVEKREGLEFLDALEWLANRAGIEFSRVGHAGARTGSREQLFALNNIAAAFYEQQLRGASSALAYLEGRGVTAEVRRRWRIGYAAEGWETLADHLRSSGADIGAAVQAGLVRRRSSSGCYDAFRARIIFPIHDVLGRVIGFGGRALGDEQPKYLNTEQTPLFDKSRTLYGLDRARLHIGPESPAVLVEGYLDVIAAHEAGIARCVAPLGTAFTAQHALTLARYGPRLVICFDADSAGIKAALRAADTWQACTVEHEAPLIACLPPGDDPDTLVRSGRINELHAAIGNAAPSVQFELDLLLGQPNAGHTATAEQRRRAFTDAIRILRTEPSVAERSRYAQQIVRLHPLNGRYSTPQVIALILEEIAGRSAAVRPAGRTPQQRAATDGAAGRSAAVEPAARPLPGWERAERCLLRGLLDPVRRPGLLKQLKPEIMATDAGRYVMEFVASVVPDGASLSLQQLGERLQRHGADGHTAEAACSLVESMKEEDAAPLANEPLTDAALAGCILRLQQRASQCEAEELRIRSGFVVTGADAREQLARAHQVMKAAKPSGTAEP